MSHGPRLTDYEQAAVESCLRGTCKAMTFDTSTRLVFLQSTGHGGQAANPADPAFAPEVLNKVPVVFPYGFLSLAPGGPKVETELLETAAGVLCVAVRTALPAGIPTPAAGDSLQFGSGGAYAHVPASGDTVLEPNSGNTVKLGSSATKAVGIHGDAVNKDATIPAGDFASWMASVEALANAGTGGTVAPSCTLITKLGTVAASAQKAKAE